MNKRFLLGSLNLVVLLCLVAVWVSAVVYGQAAPEKASDVPRRLSPAEHGVGRRIPDLRMTDIAGVSRSLGDCRGYRALVIAFTSTTCPVSKRYLPVLARLEKQFRDRNVAFWLVDPIATDTKADLEVAARDNNLTAPIVLDSKGQIAAALGAESTTEVFVLDSASTLVYRGAVDDQYGLSHSLGAPRNTYLVDALEALLTNQTPAVAATSSPGCALGTASAKSLIPGNTYHNRTSRIVQDRCVECHRSGGSAPFSLETYAELVSHSAMVRQVVERGTMPPWFAAQHAPGADSPWANDPSLTSSEKNDLVAWTSGTTAIGDPSHAPITRMFTNGWRIGKPDAILQIPEPVAVNAEGNMPYHLVTVQTDYDEDKWVRALEIQPTARQVVHHALVFVLPKPMPGEGVISLERRVADVRNGFFAVYVPGNGSLTYPDGFAKRLPAGATLLFQIHYTPSGKAETDQTRLGLVFLDKAPAHEVYVAGISDSQIRIPPGAENHRHSAGMNIPQDVKVIGFLPHMHLRGKAFRYELVRPDGSKQTLLDIPRYDPNWQLYYRLTDPIRALGGSRMVVTGWYDNSKNNPANPDPTAVVRWGPQLKDEMLQGYVEYFVTEPPSGGRSRQILE